MKVHEIMTKKVIKVAPENTIKDALMKLKKKNISGLPVVNEEGKVVGLVTEADILKFLGGDIIDLIEKNGLKKKLNEKVLKVMKKKVITCKENEEIKEVIKKMNKHKINRIVVVNEENKVIGIVAREDILKALVLMEARKKAKKVKKKKSERIVTIDDLLNLVKERKKIKLEEAAKELNLSESLIEEWAKILDEHGLIKIKYPLLGKPILMKK